VEIEEKKIVGVQRLTSRESRPSKSRKSRVSTA
jgi:hypothetical protein